MTHYIVEITEVSENGAWHSMMGRLHNAPRYRMKKVLDVTIEHDPLKLVVDALDKVKPAPPKVDSQSEVA